MSEGRATAERSAAHDATDPAQALLSEFGEPPTSPVYLRFRDDIIARLSSRSFRLPADLVWEWIETNRQFVEVELFAKLPVPQRDDLPALASKTLILWGKKDREVAVDRAVRLFHLIPGSELHIFDECGRWVQWDQAPRFNQLVSAFLKATR